MSRTLNPRLAKLHRTYTVDEVAKLYGVNKNTVRQWLKNGLRTVDDRRPALVRGPDLRAYLTARRETNRRPCAPGEVFCVACRVPRRPAGDAAEYQPMTPSVGNLVGTCPACGRRMFRRVRRADVAAVAAGLGLVLKDAPGHIGESG